MPPNERTYVVIHDRIHDKHYAGEIEGGESHQMAARRLVKYYELPGPNQFACYTATAEHSGRAIDVVKRGGTIQVTATDVNGEQETFTTKKWCYVGILYYNGAPN